MLGSRRAPGRHGRSSDVIVRTRCRAAPIPSSRSPSTRAGASASPRAARPNRDSWEAAMTCGAALSLGINLASTRIGTIVAYAVLPHHARPARWCTRGALAACALRSSRRPPPATRMHLPAGRRRRDSQARPIAMRGRRESNNARGAPRSSTTATRALRPGGDSRRACVSAGADAREARQGRAPRGGGHRPRRVRRSRGGVRVRFRGHWLRYAMRGVLDPETSSPFLVLSGPGMDSDAAPGLTRPDDDQGALDLSEALRARCVEEAARVGDLARRVQRHGRPVVESAGGCGGGRGRRRQRQWRHHSYRSEGRTRRRVRVRAVRGRGARRRGGGAETAVRGDRRPPPSRRGDLRGGSRSATTRSLSKVVFQKTATTTRRRRRRRRDERRRRPSVRFAEEVRGPPSGIRGGHARRRAWATASGLDPDVGLGAAGARSSRRRCLSASSAATGGATRSRGQPPPRSRAALSAAALSAAALSAVTPAGALKGPPPTRVARASSGVWRPPGRLRGGGGSGAARVAGGGGGGDSRRARAGRRAPRVRRRASRGRAGAGRWRRGGSSSSSGRRREQRRGEQRRKRTPRSRRVSGTTPSRSARTSRACASPSPPRGALRRAPVRPGGAAGARGPAGRVGRLRGRLRRVRRGRCTICPTTARSPQPRRRAPARRRRRRRTAWRGSAAP